MFVIFTIWGIKDFYIQDYFLQEKFAALIFEFKFEKTQIQVFKSSLESVRQMKPKNVIDKIAKIG
jgi:hypothetical protein